MVGNHILNALREVRGKQQGLSANDFAADETTTGRKDLGTGYGVLDHLEDLLDTFVSRGRRRPTGCTVKHGFEGFREHPAILWVSVR